MAINARAGALVLAAALGVLAPTACSGGGDDKPTARPAAPSTTQETTSTTAVLPTTTVTSLLAGVEGDIPGIRLELNTLERSNDEVVRLAFTLVNNGTSAFTIGDNFGTDGSVSGIAIVDTANEQLLATLTDDSGACRCSRDLSSIEPGAKASLYAELASPPADIGLVSVVVPHFPGVQRIRMS